MHKDVTETNFGDIPETIDNQAAPGQGRVLAGAEEVGMTLAMKYLEWIDGCDYELGEDFFLDLWLSMSLYQCIHVGDVFKEI